MEQTTTFNTRLATPEDVEVLEEAATDYANSMKILQEMFWWTSKDSRNKGVGTVLLKELEAKAKQFEVDLISLSILDSSPKIGGWLKSNNYSVAESCYFKFLEGKWL